MYIPKHFYNDDRQSVLDFMQKFNFATLVTSENGRPIATHLPFVIDVIDDKIILSTHLSKVNPQHQKKKNNEIFIYYQQSRLISPLRCFVFLFFFSKA